MEATTQGYLISAVPQFTVPDLVKTAEYYRDVLGFEIDGYFGSPPVFAIVWRDRVEIFFSRSDQSEVRTGRARGAYDLYLRIRGVDDLAENLRSKGGEILEGPTNRIYNQRELVVKDCNGLILCFGEQIVSSGEGSF